MIIVLHKAQMVLKKCFESGGYKVVENKPMQKTSIGGLIKGCGRKTVGGNRLELFL